MKQIQKTIDVVDNYQQKHTSLGFGYAVIKKYGDNHVGYLAALLTYYGFLALFPLLMVLTTIADNLLGGYAELEKTILDGVNDYFPVLGGQLSSHIHGLQGSGFALVAGLLFALYGARGVAEVFQLGIKRIWGFDAKKSPGFPAGLVKSLTIIIVGGFGFILAAVIASAAATAGQGWLFRGVSVGINLFIIFCVLFFLISICLPKTNKHSDVKLAAICGAVGLVILQSIGGYLLARQLRSLDALYSYFAVTLGLLFWIYLQAQVIYYANVIAVVKSQKNWPRSFKS